MKRKRFSCKSVLKVGGGSKVTEGFGSDVKYCLRLLTRGWRMAGIAGRRRDTLNGENMGGFPTHCWSRPRPCWMRYCFEAC